MSTIYDIIDLLVEPSTYDIKIYNLDTEEERPFNEDTDEFIDIVSFEFLHQDGNDCLIFNIYED